MLVETRGLKFDIRTNVPTDAFVVDDVINNDTYGWVKEPLEESVVLDIGANIGTFTVLAAQKGNFVYAFEPEPANYECLIKNCRLNNCNARLFNLALGSAGVTKITQQGGGSRTGTNQGIFPCLVVSLKDVIDFIGAEIDFLKMDVEGAEYDIILDCPEGYLRKIRRFAMEVHKDLISDTIHEEMLEKLERCFYIDYSCSAEGRGVIKGLRKE